MKADELLLFSFYENTAMMLPTKILQTMPTIVFILRQCGIVCIQQNKE